LSRVRAFPVSDVGTSPTREPLPLEARGKFFFAGSEKVLLKGVTYGPFPPASSGDRFPDPERVDQDLAIVRELGANTIRTFTVPPRWLLDRAGRRGLRVLVGIPWAEHVCFLDSKELTRSIRQSVAQAVEQCEGHAAVAAYLIGNEIPPDIVRWYGAKRVAAMPEIPTIAEAGLPGYEFTTWHGMLAPKGTPRAVIALLNERLKKTMAAPDQMKRFEERGLDVIASSPEEFSTHLQSEFKKWGRVIKERGMRAE